MTQELKPIEILIDELNEAKKQLNSDELDPDLKEIFMPLSTAALRACNMVLETLSANITTTSFEEAVNILTPSDSTVTKTYKSFYASYVALGFQVQNPGGSMKTTFKGFYSGSWVSLFDRYKENPEALKLGKKKFKTIYTFLKKNHYLMQYGQGYGKAIFLMDTPEIKIDHLFPVLFDETTSDFEYIREYNEKTDENIDAYLVDSVVKRNQELDNENRLLKLKLQDLQDGFF